ncbi:thiol reductant ABC exporter subunit CydD [Halomonas sp. PAMB 3264]|uniref:thiol reductant ABC exporter subunit CydD n=1 Tax=Halomonas sp. PAMB 3264 TaxID=3075222 RepID=UPI0028991185|nr:thiol reductant ABC exporter subunit CydD [Halomonas sp. PAMB 3264]WNL40819.1 thiol reductant ABC exporter subunit CydD [Halomonas sp. PAMB 3264]
MRSAPPSPATLTPRQWLKQLALAEKKRLSGAAVCGVLAGASTTGLLVGLAWLVDQILVHARPLSGLSSIFLMLLALVGLRAALQWGQEVLAFEASLRIRQRVRTSLLDKLATLGPLWLTHHQSGALATQLVEHVDALEGYFARFHPQLRIVLILPLLIAAVVGALDYVVVIFLLLSAPLIPLFMALVGMGAERMNREQFSAVSRLSAHFVDRVRGMSTLQLFGRTAKARRDVWYATDEYRRLSMKTLRLAFLSSAVLEFFASVAIAVVAMYVGFGLLGYLDFGPAASLSLFSGLAVLLLAPEFFQPLRTLSQHYHDRATALGAAESLVFILNEPDWMPQTHVVPRHDPALCELKGVSVGYPQRDAILSHVDLAIAQGDILALTGASGSGKSSLLALLAGFMAPQEGALYRRSDQIAWLDQSPCLIQGSLAENLRLANPEAGERALLDALARAGLGELLTALPQGLETPLGERGVGLSGGQAQRLALARVYLSAAPLVLLDEPTSNLDAATEALVIDALKAWARDGRTLVIATHHPQVLTIATRHLHCDGGRVLEVTP